MLKYYVFVDIIKKNLTIKDGERKKTLDQRNLCSTSYNHMFQG